MVFMDFRISNTFTDSLARLTSDKPKAARTTDQIERLRMPARGDRVTISRSLTWRSAAMNTRAIYLRLGQPRLTEVLSDTPVVLIHGPHQCAKTTAFDLQPSPASPRPARAAPDRAVLSALPCRFQLVP